jgi:sugar O-acyltransferase (sialic acid O-acetyltransferase NeuD family)
MAADLIIYGSGQMAEFAYARLQRDSRYRIIGFTVDRSHLRADMFCGLPIVAFEEIERHFPVRSVCMFIAVGPVQCNRVRADRFAQAKSLGYRLISYVSPQAIVDPDVAVGENCSIGESAIVQAFSRVGDDVRIGSASVIGHHCVLEDHCFVGVGSILAGSVRVGRRAFIGVNATIRDRISIGEGCVIGAGATIVRDTVPGSVHAAPESIVLPLSSDRVRF